MNDARRNRRLMTMTAIAAAIGPMFALPALAQDQDAGAIQGADESQDTIVVTGSRIRRSTADTAAPITDIGLVDFEDRGYVSAAEALNRVPSLTPQLNQADGAPAATDGHGLRLAAEDAMPDACFILARRNILTRNGSNVSAGGEGFQARVDVRGWSSVELGDSEISDGGGDGGLRIDALEQAHLRIANLTVADNAGTGISLLREADADVQLHNTLIYGNGKDVLPSEASAASHNLVGMDPHFVAPGNYRLRATSPARDAGTNHLPGFFWATDADGGNRLVGSAIDIGAYEFGSFRVFADGFED